MNQSQAKTACGRVAFALARHDVPSQIDLTNLSGYDYVLTRGERTLSVARHEEPLWVYEVPHHMTDATRTIPCYVAADWECYEGICRYLMEYVTGRDNTAYDTARAVADMITSAKLRNRALKEIYAAYDDAERNGIRPPASTAPAREPYAEELDKYFIDDDDAEPPLATPNPSHDEKPPKPKRKPAPRKAASRKTTKTVENDDDMTLEQYAAKHGLTYTTNNYNEWVGGETKPHKDALKAYGMQWAPKRQAWYRRVI